MVSDIEIKIYDGHNLMMVTFSNGMFPALRVVGSRAGLAWRPFLKSYKKSICCEDIFQERVYLINPYWNVRRDVRPFTSRYFRRATESTLH